MSVPHSERLATAIIRDLTAERDKLQENVTFWQDDSRAAWEKCEERRIAQEAAEASVKSLEAMRPHWAKGYTSDGVAAQTTAVALNGLWRLLGAKDQTEAHQKLIALVSRARELEYALDDIRRARTRHAASGFPVGLYPDPAAWMERRADQALDMPARREPPAPPHEKESA